MIIRKLTTASALLTLAAIASSAFAQGGPPENTGWQVTIGTGVLVSPTYKGDNDYRTMAVPNLSANYKDTFQISVRGLEYTAYNKNGWKAGPIVSYDFGRESELEKNALTIAGDTSNDLLGLDDIEAGLQIGGFVEYQTQAYSAKLKLDKGIDGGHEGIVGEAGLSFRKMLKIKGPPIFLSAGPTISFGDDNYNSAYFDVSATGAAASGLSEYNAGSGIHAIGLRTAAFMPTGKKTSVVAIFGYDSLVGDAANSSIVKERGSKDQFSGGFFFNYRF